MAEDKDEEIGEFGEEEGSSMMTALVTGAAVAVFAPELLPGMAIGVAAMLAPRVLPTLGTALRPLVKTVVRAGYATAVSTREMVAEAGEQVQDMVAEARAEQGNGRPAVRHRRGGRQSTKRRAS